MNGDKEQINNDALIPEVEEAIVVPDPSVPADEAGIVVPEAEAVVEAVVAPKGKITPGRRMRDSARRGGRSDGPKNSKGGGRGRPGDSRDRIKPEFDSKMIDIRRVTRVAAGGRRYSFSVAVVAGDRKGRVGVGLGKGGDTSLAIEKATREAKKHLIKVPLSAQMIIPHAVEAKYGSARIMIFPARGRGIVAGSSARNVIELAGIKDVCAKVMSGSKNKINIAKAAIAALDKLIKLPKSTFRTENQKLKV
jgi:small subunit ribosomal protein S5